MLRLSGAYLLFHEAGAGARISLGLSARQPQLIFRDGGLHSHARRLVMK